MKKILPIFSPGCIPYSKSWVSTLVFVLGTVSLVSAQKIRWQTSLGGTKSDVAYSIVATSDGGYVVSGRTESNDGNVSGNHGNVNAWTGGLDAWVVKLNSSGAMLWQKTLGGSANDFGDAVAATADGGCIVAATADSKDGKVSGNKGARDIWLVKLNSSGAILWQKNLGGTGSDKANAIVVAKDGGFVVAGSTTSTDGDVRGYHGKGDAWVAKVNATGTILWQLSLGGSEFDQGNSIAATAEGGYLVAGTTQSKDGNVSGTHGLTDMWVVKLNDRGAIQWQKALGGSKSEEGYAITAMRDGDCLVAGRAESNDGDVSGNHANAFGEFDAWVVRLNATGDLLWQKALGGTSLDQAYAVTETKDGNGVVAIATQSVNGDVTGNHGTIDIWVVKLGNGGKVLWQKTLGGRLLDEPRSIIKAPDGGFVLAGASMSTDGDVSGNHGNHDFWVVQFTEPIYRVGGVLSSVWDAINRFFRDLFKIKPS